MRRIAETREIQDRFLEAYTIVGTIKGAREAAKVSRPTVWRWEDDDYLGFRERFRIAKAEHADYIEGVLFNRIDDPKCAPLLVMMAVNGAKPEKYKAALVSDDSVKSIMGELRSMSKAAPPAVPSPKETSVPDTIRELLASQDGT
jgi:hypothetical protein